METGSRIAKLRIRSSLSQSKLAKAMKTNVSTIKKWEHGVSIPTVDHIIDLATLFKVTSDYLLCLDDKPVMVLDGLSQSEIDFLNDIVQALRRRRPF